MAYGNAYDATKGKEVARKVVKRITETHDEDSIAKWGQGQWNASTSEAIFDLSDELSGDDVKSLIAYATEDCSGWELLEISLESSLGAAIWCLWEDGE